MLIQRSDKVSQLSCRQPPSLACIGFPQYDAQPLQKIFFHSVYKFRSTGRSSWLRVSHEEGWRIRALKSNVEEVI